MISLFPLKKLIYHLNKIPLLAIFKSMMLTTCTTVERHRRQQHYCYCSSSDFCLHCLPFPPFTTLPPRKTHIWWDLMTTLLIHHIRHYHHHQISTNTNNVSLLPPLDSPLLLNLTISLPPGRCSSTMSGRCFLHHCYVLLLSLMSWNFGENVMQCIFVKNLVYVCICVYYGGNVDKKCICWCSRHTWMME